jgi:RimJ/RimL family protein N-acetyltransferase
MLLGPTLQTARLIVRPPQLTDLDQWVMTDPDNGIARNSGTPEDMLRHHADLLKLAGTWALNGFGSLLLFKKDDGVLIGRVGPSRPLDWPEIEVGWALLPEFTGQGYALEGAAAAMDFALLELGRERVVHTIRPPNIASKKLATRLGSRNLGPIALPPPYKDVLNEGWYQTRQEWAVNRERDLVKSGFQY